MRYCASTVNSSGAAARIETLGTTSVAANDFVLRASDCPAGVSAVFFAGTRAQQVPFSDGYLCIKSPVIRMGPLAVTGPAGSLARAVDLPTFPLSITAGAILDFQCWFRDGAAGGAGANLTDAVNVRFCP